tara:strand:+ start:29634 stop:30416 length:783 start_codon:yes stop_codon:yes gene_type:complete
MQQAGKTALVTGASAGLGKEFSRQLAAAGYRLVLVSRSQAPLDALAAELEAAHGTACIVVPADLSRAEAPAEIFAVLQEQGVAVDYLVNNAGSAGPGLLRDRDWGAQQAFYQLMMLSIAHLCHLFVPPMVERGWGRVINVASVAGRIPRGGDCNYGPSKAWVIALSEELSLTVADDGVKVCALCPGFTHTEFHARAGLGDMKNSMPAWFWYNAETVVREGLAAVERGKRVYSSGRLYRIVDPLLQSVWTRRFFSLNDGRT